MPRIYAIVVAILLAFGLYGRQSFECEMDSTLAKISADIARLEIGAPAHIYAMHPYGKAHNIYVTLSLDEADSTLRCDIYRQLGGAGNLKGLKTFKIRTAKELDRVREALRYKVPERLVKIGGVSPIGHYVAAVDIDEDVVLSGISIGSPQALFMKSDVTDEDLRSKMNLFCYTFNLILTDMSDAFSAFSVMPENHATSSDWHDIKTRAEAFVKAKDIQPDSWFAMLNSKTPKLYVIDPTNRKEYFYAPIVDGFFMAQGGSDKSCAELFNEYSDAFEAARQSALDEEDLSEIDFNAVEYFFGYVGEDKTLRITGAPHTPNELFNISHDTECLPLMMMCYSFRNSICN